MTLLNAADFGIVGDGVTESTAGFLALRQLMLSDPEAMWEVEFPPGHYLTQSSTMLANVGRARFVGYGATLQQSIANKGLFAPHEIFRNLHTFTAPTQSSHFEHHPGWLIASAEAAQHEVKFLNGVVPAGVVPGANVFLGGFNQQITNETPPRGSGWPPNLRFFEYGVVHAASNDTAVLRGRLGHSYDEAWTDYDGDYFGPYKAGAPRLYLLDRPNFGISRHIEFHGFRFMRAAGSGATGGSASFTSCLYLLLQDCDWAGTPQVDNNGGFLQMCDRIEMRRCRMDDLEVDKNIRHLLIEDCDIGRDASLGFTSFGAGCQTLELRNSRFHGLCAINPRIVIADNVQAHRNFQLNAAHGGYYDTAPFAVTVRAARL